MKNLRRKFLLWQYVIFLLGGFSIVFLFIGLDWGKNSSESCLAMISLLMWWFFVILKLINIKCPKCNESLMPSPIETFASKNLKWAFKLGPPKKCRICNYDLTTHSS
ncbi:hypothetical protein S1OALGB6SA_79, partial [Olavius algarvensis spirochete endosymbiont]